MRRPKQPALFPQDVAGNLPVTAADTPEAAMAKQFCNRWGWKKDLPAMLLDLQDLLEAIKKLNTGP